ncbi:MAG: hypothetical protein M1819_004952 [Sarea resinae]|nr:MAG: hypothetical protein M1819_004952 [Sarea resinae]
MADVHRNGFLAPPKVAALKQEAAGAEQRGHMERSLSSDIREEREDLQEAAEQALNVILDLGLDGRVRWVSPTWEDVIGTDPASVQGKPIADILLDDKTAFDEAVASMKKDDSTSQIVRFSVLVGPSSLLRPDPTEAAVQAEDEGFRPEEVTEQENTISLEGQGIMIYDRASGEMSHTMWMIRPSVEPREVTIDLPELLLNSLGIGAEMLARYLTALAEVGANDPGNHPPPLPVLCRICERQITPWWFEKHSELCLQEHRAEMDVQLAQEGLSDHRNAIVKVLDALEARSDRPVSGELSSAPIVQAEYKGLAIGPSSTPPSGTSSGTVSPANVPARSRESSATGLGHNRARSFAVRRPLTRIVELLLDLCDTAIEISTPAIKDSRNPADIRTQSPQSDNRISQVVQWQSPSTNTLEQEQGLATLCADTERAARAKVDAVLRHRKILEYSERIRIEFTAMVQDSIDAAMRKAARIAAGQLSESSDSSSETDTTAQGEEEEEEETDEEEEKEQGNSFAHEDAPFFPGSFDGPSKLTKAIRNASNHSLASSPSRRQSSAAGSTRSSSPKEAPTPRSHKGAMSILGQGRPSKRASMFGESDAGDSDSSMRSSIFPGAWRTESPSSDVAVSRSASSRGRNRGSLILPSAASQSPHRQESPARTIPPSSPLRISKPRIPNPQDVPSPVMSPLLSTSETSSPALAVHQHHHHHHRRQSSAASSEAMKPPVSPRLTSTQPQARAVPPSIKDFEIIKPISKGAFGSVYLSKKKSTGDYFAIKVLKKADMVAKNQVTNVKAERAIMMWQGESDFVAKLYWTFSSKDYLYLVMEYLNGGDCASLIKVLGGLSEDWAKKYLAEVVLGVEHLHERGIVHRDLKPDNLLIDQKGHLKLTDFGLSRMGLIGRQKRLLESKVNESAPDLLKQGPFARAMSTSSSRSTSFDLQGNHSPGSTPHLTPDLAGQLVQPSYFSLNRDGIMGREHARRASGQRSDSGGSESLHAMFRNFSLSEPSDPQGPRGRSPIEEESRSEGSGSPDIYALQPVASHSSVGQHSTPPQSSLMPPPMALFDPEDSNRRFVGTPDYLAPETINGIGQDEMSDWWSLGCILFEFIFGYPPFHADTPEKVFENILARRIDWPSEEDCPVSEEAKDLMERLMCINPKNRLGSNIQDKYASGGEEIRMHPWFKDLNWATVREDQAEFIPAPENIEDTEYFDSRGAKLQSFAEEFEDQSSPPVTPGADYPERPHDALSRVRTQVNTMKRGMMPLHIPPHVRDGRTRRLSEPVAADDFGSFAFKNLPVLEKANKDVIQKLRAEAMQAQSKPAPTSHSATAGSPVPSLEGSPILPIPLKRTQSSNKGSNRPESPSSLSQAHSSSPSRASQPSSPLLVSFSAGQNQERRKTSSTSSSISHQSGTSLQPGSFFDMPRLSNGLKTSSTASSPVKTVKSPMPLSPERTLVTPRHASPVTTRDRSRTVGSQEGEIAPPKDYTHHKRRSQVMDISPSSSDNEDPRAKALLRVQRRRQSSRKMSQISLADGPIFRPLDILVCEDHPVSRMVMEKLLEKLRCRTIAVENGSEAMRFAMSDVKFDLIMMEFKLPKMNGTDVARMIRDTKNANSQTPIVAVTGYLKELQAPHHFDALIEKPPTLTKFTEVLSRLCQWKTPPPNYIPPQIQTVPRSGLRQESSVREEDSPSSVSSGAIVPDSSFRGSSREDSISSSFFGDFENANDDIPVIISRHVTDDWTGGGLCISEEAVLDPKPKPPPSLPLQKSAPAAPAAPAASEDSKPPRKQRSADAIKAKRGSMEKRQHECAESGDDEDEELGDVQVRAARSPQAKTHRAGSKLGIEMMRTNSRGSVISMEDMAARGSTSSPPPAIKEDVGGEKIARQQSRQSHHSLTPPEVLSRAPAGKTWDVDLDTTPKPPSRESLERDDEPTPRAPSSHSLRP